jgi:hypothetical protein
VFYTLNRFAGHSIVEFACKLYKVSHGTGGQRDSIPIAVIPGNRVPLSPPDAYDQTGNGNRDYQVPVLARVSTLRVVHAVQIVDQGRPRWLPVQFLLRKRAGGRHITPGEVAKPAEVCARLLGLDADHRHF